LIEVWAGMRHRHAFVRVARHVVPQQLEALIVGVDLALVLPACLVRRLDVARDRIRLRVLRPSRDDLIDPGAEPLDRRIHDQRMLVPRPPVVPRGLGSPEVPEDRANEIRRAPLQEARMVGRHDPIAIGRVAHHTSMPVLYTYALSPDEPHHFLERREAEGYDDLRAGGERLSL